MAEYSSNDQHYFNSQEMICILCDLSFVNHAHVLRHLLTIHHIVIEDVESIADLTRYLVLWKQKSKKLNLHRSCLKIKNMLPDSAIGKPEWLFLLSPLVEADREVRCQVGRIELELALIQQQAERENYTTTSKCLFCEETFYGNRSLVLDHLLYSHNFNLGHPDNLVYVADLLSHIRNQLDELLCLYCEKTFKSRHVLKEHMRKKFHKKLNPKNRSYDRYYLTNYLDWCNPTSSDVRTVHPVSGKGSTIGYVHHFDCDIDDGCDEQGWKEMMDSVDCNMTCICLFCSYESKNTQRIFNHMKASHSFDFLAVKNENNLNFYEQLKMINYIRRQVLEVQCLSCSEKFQSHDELMSHMEHTNHIVNFCLDTKTWNQPEYFFPTLDDDNLINGLICDDSSCSTQDSVSDSEVIPEDAPSVSDEVISLMKHLELLGSGDVAQLTPTTL